MWNKLNSVTAGNPFSVHCDLQQTVWWFRTSNALSSTKIAAGV